jgi:hypothetical protein
MKLLSVAAALCLFSSLLAAQSTTSFHSKAEGASVSATVNGTAIDIQVSRGASSTNLLTLTLTQNPDGSFTSTEGFGAIPNADFVNGGLQHMSLNVDTSQVPGFRSVSCTVSFTPFFTETCGQGPLGLIQVNWVNNRITTSSVLEEEHLTSGGLTVDTHTDADTSSANASGSYLGLSFPVADNASVRMNRNTTITITQ